VDHSPLQRGDDVIAKFASVCISGVMQPGNMLYQKVAGNLRGKVTPGQLASHFAKTYIAMSYAQLLSGMLYGLATDDEEAVPAWHRWLTQPLENAVGWIPYVREAPSVIRYGSYGAGLPQLGKAAQEIEHVAGAVKKTAKGEYGAASWKSVQAFAYLAGIPLPAAARIARDADRGMGLGLMAPPARLGRPAAAGRADAG
jgi:hypothetical protein